MTGSLKTRPVIGSVLALAVLVGNGALSVVNTFTVSDNDEWVAHTYAVLGKLDEALATLTEAETGERGYVITGDPRYLAAFQTSRGNVRKCVDELRVLTRDNPDQQDRVADLESQILARLLVLDDTMTRRQKDGFAAARDLIVTGDALTQLKEIRGVADELRGKELGLLRARQDRAARSFLMALVTNSVGVLAGVGLVSLTFVLMIRDRTEELTRGNELLREEVDQRRLAEEQVRHSAAELRRSNRELQAFAAVASHDLQEPLRKIQAFGDRLKSRYRDELGEAGRDYLDRMQAAAARMATLINDLLTYSRVASRAQPFVPVNLAAVAREVLSDLEARLQQSEGRVELGALPTVDADPMQMRQLLQNLIGNGLKFRKPDAAPVVEVAAELTDGDAGVCRLTVRDNGIGFDEAYKERIFGFFQRLHGRNEYEGTGMGLAICRRIVERHGGTITTTSQPGQGATFTVTLPRHQPTETAPGDQPSQTDHDFDGGR